MKKGALTIATLLTVATPIVLVIAGYYANVLSTSDKISEAKATINSDISTDRERIATLEEAIKTIKDSQLETRNDVKEILRRLK